MTATGVALVRRRITDPVLETVVALVTPYAAYVVAEALGVSGMTSVVVASVLLGSRTAARRPRTPGCSCTRCTRRSSSCWKASSSR